MDEYYVPYLAYGEGQFEEKRSKFTGRLWRVESAEEAIDKIKQTRESFWNATHNCWAYLIKEGNLMRYSDDGEPQGTAGMPILEVLRHENLQNVCCVVTRYFGGILLGTGGLVRAYTKGAKVSVEVAGIAQMSRFSIMLIAVPYSLLSVVERILQDYDTVIDEKEYGTDVTLTVSIPVGKEEELNGALRDHTAGTVEGEIVDSRFMGRKIK